MITEKIKIYKTPDENMWNNVIKQKLISFAEKIKTEIDKLTADIGVRSHDDCLIVRKTEIISFIDKLLEEYTDEN
jgi:hypothetical protein